MATEFNSRKKERRCSFSYVEKNKRKTTNRRGRAQKEIDIMRRKKFERHLNAQI